MLLLFPVIGLSVARVARVALVALLPGRGPVDC